jgi:hypothetical protein
MIYGQPQCQLNKILFTNWSHNRQHYFKGIIVKCIISRNLAYTVFLIDVELTGKFTTDPQKASENNIVGIIFSDITIN